MMAQLEHQQQQQQQLLRQLQEQAKRQQQGDRLRVEDSASPPRSFDATKETERNEEELADVVVTPTSPGFAVVADDHHPEDEEEVRGEKSPSNATVAVAPPTAAVSV
jgi:hypothetical protein